MRLVGATKAETEDLATYVKRVRGEVQPPLSQRDVANRSGGYISHGYVSLIERRGVLGPGVSPKRLLGLSRALGRPLEEIVAIALGIERDRRTAREVDLIGFFKQLPEDRQNEAIGFMEVLSKNYGKKKKSVA